MLNSFKFLKKKLCGCLWERGRDTCGPNGIRIEYVLQCITQEIT